MQQFRNCHSTVTAENGIRPLTINYYCTAVWPQLNNLTYAQFNRPLIYNDVARIVAYIHI